MDNLTHSLLGVAIGRATERAVGDRRAAIATAIIASNAPDLDIVLRPFFDDVALGYLVHHRGHTHTLLGAVPLGLLGAAAIKKWRPHARSGPLAAVGAVAGLGHIGADAWNNYGVHPFWPFENTWYYGDFIFIIEPTLWALLLPLAFASGAERTRGVVGAITLLLGIAVTVGLGFLPLLLWVGGLGLVYLGLRQRPVGTLLAVATALTVFFSASRLARARVQAALPAHETVLDVVRNPTPGTPWCWQVITATRDQDTYIVRSGELSLLPSFTPPANCRFRALDSTVRLEPSDLPEQPHLSWRGRYTAPITELHALMEAHCRIDTYLHFARVPWWQDGWLGDFRYDYEPGAGFAEVPIEAPGGCSIDAPWRSTVVQALVD